VRTFPGERAAQRWQFLEATSSEGRGAPGGRSCSCSHVEKLG